MIPKGLFTQIGMIIVSVAIIMTYVQPEFNKISEVQDSIDVYKRERAKVETANAKLDSLMSRLRSVSNEDMHKLNIYMPDEIDEISIRRDMLLMTQEAGLLYNDSSYEESSSGRSRNSNVSKVGVNDPTPNKFELSVEGTYSQLKRLFDLLEHNHYPLEVTTLNVTQLEGGFLSSDIQLTTYAYKVPEGNK